jgi:hypothetical protein
MTVHRPGDVLAGRYRLADLLSESDHGRFWLAHDSILGRPVAVHVLDADDPRAPGLMKAARASASISDQCLLRVLDAETREGISYVVNEWGRGTSLDILLARSGPLSAERAAWITAQVAATLARAHDLGYAHGRLNPENVLIDEAGEVRLIGFAVEAALYGLPEGTAAEDDAALAGLLVAGLTGTWPGTNPSSVPATPLDGDHPMRPRQVRAGVPRVLDDLCEAALNPTARGRHEGPIVDARYLHDRLMAFVGQPPDLSEIPRERRTPAGDANDATTVRPLTGTHQAPEAIRHTPLTGQSAGTAPAPASSSGASTPSDPSEDGEATQHGLPSFEDDDSWHRPRNIPAPPPPKLDPPAPKPLFADEDRRPRSDETSVLAARDVTSGGSSDQAAAGFWPWQEEAAPAPAPTAAPAAEERPRKHWQALAFGFVALLLVIAAVLVVREMTHEDDSAGTGGTGSSSPTGGAASPITGLTATDFDPYGDPQSENPDEAKYAVDGKPSTSWQTNTYSDQLGDHAPALKSGVGLVIDLHRSYSLANVTLTVAGGDTGVSFFVDDTRPTTPNGLKTVASATITQAGQKVALHDAVGRYLVVWLTRLPDVGDGFRGSVAEVSVSGAHVG